ncbi:MAG: cysteine--tRNA ligase, partial [Hymenobacter sp.]
LNGLRLLDKLSDELVSGEVVSEPEVPAQPGPPSPAQQLRNLAAKPFGFLNDDLNTPRAVAALFDLLKRFNTLATNPEALAEVGPAALAEAATTYRTLVQDILGLRDEPRANTDDLLGLTLSFYQEAKATKAYDKVDQIRAALKSQGIVIKDTKTGVEWAYSEE